MRLVTRTSLITLSLLLITSAVCHAQRKSKKHLDISSLTGLAWNGDTVNSYTFALANGKEFSYTIIHNGGKKQPLITMAPYPIR